MELPSCCRRSLAFISALLLAHPWRHPTCVRADPKNLEPPWNVQVHITDPKFTVQWDRPMNSTADIGQLTFSAYYRLSENNNTKWKKLSGCRDVTATTCNFTTELDDFESYDVHVRAKRGNRTSRWSNIVRFFPRDIAVPGPPSAVQMEPVDDSINLNISPPGNLKIFDAADLMYKLEIWKNNSAEQPTTIDVCAMDTVDGVVHNTTYCMKVLAFEPSDRAEGPYSPVYCTQTAGKVQKDRPETVRIDAVNTKFVLRWDWNNEYDKNVNFTVQFRRYSCLAYASNKDSWESVSNCKDIINTECDLSSSITFLGSYYFRVMAVSGTWSKTIKFNPLENTEIGPPSSITINFSDGILEITMVPPGESENKSMAEFYDLSYHVFLWKNSSSMEKMNKSGKQTFFTFPDLEPLTVYCLKAQAVANDQNKTGYFSDIQCITTAAGNSTFWKTLATFILSAVAAFLTVVAVCVVVYKLKQWVTYAFFPSYKLPSNIKECLHEHHMNKTFLNYAEEHTETCHVVENMVTEDRGSQTSQQSSRDSGNYSTEDEPGGAV